MYCFYLSYGQLYVAVWPFGVFKIGQFFFKEKKTQLKNFTQDSLNKICLKKIT